MKINQKGLDIIKSYESLHDGSLKIIGLQPKLCPANVWTEGYGRAMKFKDGSFMKKDNTTFEQACSRQTIKTKEEAEKALLEDTDLFSNLIKKNIKVNLNNDMFSACVSLAYNIGSNAFNKSSLLKKINEKDFISAANKFLEWNIYNKKPSLGLTRRRESEKNLFMQGLKELEIEEILK